MGRLVFCTIILLSTLSVWAEQLQPKYSGILPEPQEVLALDQPAFKLEAAMKIHLPADAAEPVRLAAEALQRDLSAICGLAPQIVSDLAPRCGFILLGAQDHDLTTVPPPPKQGFDAYAIGVKATQIYLSAQNESGLFYGLQTLRQMFASDGSVPAVRINDWADQKWRVLYLQTADQKMIIPKAARLKINMLIVESNWFGPLNWWYTPTGKNLAAAQKFIQAARQHNIEVVPLVQGGGWAYGVIDADPNCGEGIWVPDETVIMTNQDVSLKHPNVIRTAAMPIILRSRDKNTVYKENIDYKVIPGHTARPFAIGNTPWKLHRIPGGSIAADAVVKVDYNYMPYMPMQTPYCPNEPTVYRIIDRVLKNVIEIYHPRFIHIGHDEVICSNRCRRCRTRNLGRDQLWGQDIRRWYDKIKSLDSKITVIMGDDLVRKAGAKLLSKYVPHDVIICPWQYTQPPEEADEIRGRLGWMLAENERPTLGTSSLYTNANALAWRDELRQYRKNPNCLGFMTAHWGEAELLWARLPINAELMWSAERPDDQQAANDFDSDEIFDREEGLHATLDCMQQAALFEKKLARSDAPEHLDNTCQRLIKTINAGKMPAFIKTTSTFPENPAAQMPRLCAWYRAMWIYRELMSSPSPEKTQKMFALLTTGMPNRIAEWRNAEKQWLRTGLLPEAIKIFGFPIATVSPRQFLGDGEYPRALPQAEVCNTNGCCILKFAAPRLIMGVKLFDAVPDTYTISLSIDGKQWQNCAEIKLKSNGTAIAYWKPATAGFLRVAGTQVHQYSEEKIPEVYGVKTSTSGGFQVTAANFITREDCLANYRTSVKMNIDNEAATIEFHCLGLPKHSFAGDGIGVQIWKAPEAKNFIDIIATIDGKMETRETLCNYYESVSKIKLKGISAKVSRNGSDSWTCRLVVPLRSIGSSPKDWRINFIRKAPEETSSWAELPMEGNIFSWTAQPEFFTKLK